MINLRGIATAAAVILAAVVFIIVGCAGLTRIDAGHVGVKINYAGSYRGVEDVPAVTGWVFVNPLTQRVFEYPTYVQTAVWTREDIPESPGNEEVSFNSKEGLMITGDISLSYQLQADKIPAFYIKFRNDDLKHFTHGFLRNVARDIFNEVAGHYGIEEIYGPKKDVFLIEVRTALNNAVKDIGVIVEQFGFIGAPRIPESVAGALNSKVKATQDAIRVENELREAEAEAKKQVALANGEAQARVARAKGESEANLLLTRSITPTLLEWKRLEVTAQAVQKWDGRRPTVEGTGSGLLLQIPAPK
jgi:regulator of protease activity HflC (stomatin/prohibitin superfamily)